MKKILAVFLALALILSMAACAKTDSSSDAEKPDSGDTSVSDTSGDTTEDQEDAAPSGEGITIGLVTDIGGFGDKGYNDASLEGLNRAKEEFGLEVITIESQAVSDYVTNVETLSEAGCLLVITTGAAFSEAVAEVAPKYPDVHYIVLEGTVENLDNVSSTVSREQEGGFLLGYLAASITETDKLGFIAAIEGPAFERFETGYKAGAMTKNPDIEVLCSTIGNFTDVGAGYDTAASMYSMGVDYIAPVAGGVNQGVFQAAVDNGKLVFGAATGQFDAAPENIIASQVKLVNNQIYHIVSQAVGGELPEAGLYYSGIREELIDLLYNPEPTDAMSALLTDSLKEEIDAFRQDIMDGTLVVPGTLEELSTFTPPVS